MLQSSAKSWGDAGSRLMSLMDEMEEKNHREKLLAEARDLRSQVYQLKRTEKELLNSDGFSYDELAFEVENEPPNAASNRAKLVEAVKRQHTMEAFRWCQGMTGIKQTSQARGITLEFNPTYEGNMFGPYKIQLEATEKKRLKVYSHHLPREGSLEPTVEAQLMDAPQKRRYFKKLKVSQLKIVPLKELEEKYLSGTRLEVDVFAQSVRQYLNAYVCRICQVKDFEEKFGDQFLNLEFSPDVTSIKFGLKINEADKNESGSSSNANKGSSIILNIFLYYDLDGSLPRLGSTKIEVDCDDSEEIGQDALQDLREQCEVFYSCRLSKAVSIAF